MIVISQTPGTMACPGCVAATAEPALPVPEDIQIALSLPGIHCSACISTVERELNALPGVSCKMPGGAFYAFPNITGTGWHSTGLAVRLLEEVGVALLHGGSFGDNGHGYLRVSYAASQDAIREAMDRTGNFLETAQPANPPRA